MLVIICKNRFFFNTMTRAAFNKSSFTRKVKKKKYIKQQKKSSRHNANFFK